MLLLQYSSTVWNFRMLGSLHYSESALKVLNALVSRSKRRHKGTPLTRSHCKNELSTGTYLNHLISTTYCTHILNQSSDSSPKICRKRTGTKLNSPGRIVIDNRFKASVPCTGNGSFGPMLAHKAGEEGVVASEYYIRLGYYGRIGRSTSES